MKKLATLFLVLTMTSGCTHMISYKQGMDNYVNKHIDVVVNGWGYPTDTISSPSGNKIYVYLFSDNAKSVTSMYYGLGLSSGKVSDASKWCRTFFEVNRTSCKMIEPCI